MTPWLGLIAAYLLGSIPNSYIAGRLTRRIDLREHGSGNLGATNTFRVLGAAVAIPVLLLDVAKGWIPAWFFPQWDSSPAWHWALLYGAAAIIGHVFSAFLRFRGGKGVATAAGVFLALSPVAVLVSFGVWALTVWRSRMVSLGSILAAFTLILMLAVSERRPELLVLGVSVTAFVVWGHRANIGRIRRGEEPRFGRAS
ncbi:MAG: glycerol-3-phosphate 1-O-acyltransferase PlsY [Gemmatimonadetes bacterium]|nr:glycerol-3-phosphate 1-O-acyltransferase PlsY [Gemmatimonadota bacterium]